MNNVGIFGGTFNPIHYGHLRAAEEALENLKLDRIVFVPSASPPLKNAELADAMHRYKMVRLATFMNRNFSISDIEYKQETKSYSVNTLRELRRLYPDTEFSFILGIDAFLDLRNWRSPEELMRLTDFIVISRPSFTFNELSGLPYLKAGKDNLKNLDSGKIRMFKSKLTSGRYATMLRITPIDISSSTIRKMLRNKESIKYLLPEEVETYIISNKIYTKKSFQKRRR